MTLAATTLGAQTVGSVMLVAGTLVMRTLVSESLVAETLAMRNLVGESLVAGILAMETLVDEMLVGILVMGPLVDETLGVGTLDDVAVEAATLCFLAAPWVPQSAHQSASDFVACPFQMSFCVQSL